MAAPPSCAHETRTSADTLATSLHNNDSTRNSNHNAPVPIVSSPTRHHHHRHTGAAATTTTAVGAACIVHRHTYRSPTTRIQSPLLRHMHDLRRRRRPHPTRREVRPPAATVPLSNENTSYDEMTSATQELQWWPQWHRPRRAPLALFRPDSRRADFVTQAVEWYYAMLRSRRARQVDRLMEAEVQRMRRAMALRTGNTSTTSHVTTVFDEQDEMERVDEAGSDEAAIDIVEERHIKTRPPSMIPVEVEDHVVNRSMARDKATASSSLLPSRQPTSVAYGYVEDTMMKETPKSAILPPIVANASLRMPRNLSSFALHSSKAAGAGTSTPVAERTVLRRLWLALRRTPLRALAHVWCMIALVIIGSAMQVIMLNFWLASYPAHGSPGNYTTFAVSSAVFALFALATLALYVLIRRPDMGFLYHRSSWKLLVAVGTADMLNSLLVIYAASHTSEVLQALSTSTVPLITAFFQKRILKDPRNYCNGMVLVAFTCIVSGIVVASSYNLLQAAQAYSRPSSPQQQQQQHHYTSNVSPVTLHDGPVSRVIWVFLYFIAVVPCVLQNIMQTDFMVHFTRDPLFEKWVIERHTGIDLLANRSVPPPSALQPPPSLQVHTSNNTNNDDNEEKKKQNKEANNVVRTKVANDEDEEARAQQMKDGVAVREWSANLYDEDGRPLHSFHNSTRSSSSSTLSSFSALPLPQQPREGRKRRNGTTTTTRSSSMANSASQPLSRTMLTALSLSQQSLSSRSHAQQQQYGGRRSMNSPTPHAAYGTFMNSNSKIQSPSPMPTARSSALRSAVDAEAEVVEAGWHRASEQAVRTTQLNNSVEAVKMPESTSLVTPAPRASLANTSFHPPLIVEDMRSESMFSLATAQTHIQVGYAVPQGDDLIVKLVLLAVDTTTQAIEAFLLLPIDAMPWFGRSPSLAAAMTNFSHGLHQVLSNPDNTFYCLLYCASFVATYIGVTYLDQYNVTMCSMVIQLASPLTALLLLLVPSLNLAGDHAPWYFSVAAIALLATGSLIYVVWDQQTAGAKSLGEYVVKHEFVRPHVLMKRAARVEDDSDERGLASDEEEEEEGETSSSLSTVSNDGEDNVVETDI